MGTRSLINQVFKVQVTATVKNVLSSDPSVAATAGISFNLDPDLTSGVSEDQANRAVDYSGSLASGASVNIDLFDWAGVDAGAGDGKDPLGQQLDIEEIMAIVIHNKSAETGGRLEIQPSAANGWTPIGIHTVATGGALDPDGVLLKINSDTRGFDVADASSHQLKLTANGGAVDYRIVVLGRHDDDESSSSSSSQSSSSQSSSSSASSQSSSSSSSQSSSSSSSSP